MTSELKVWEGRGDKMQARLKLSCVNELSGMSKYFRCIYHVGLANAPCMLSKPQVLVTVNALTICIWVKLNALINLVLECSD